MTKKTKTEDKKRGEAFKDLCEKMGYGGHLSQTQFSEKAGLKGGTISRIFSGDTRTPSTKTIVKIVKELSASGESRESVLDRILEIYEGLYSDNEKKELREECAASEPQTGNADRTQESGRPEPLPGNLRHNLPAPRELIGREQKLNKLLKKLSFESGVHLIGIEGAGGVGKTALILEAASCCRKESEGSGNSSTISPRPPVFDAIIFTSAQTERLDKDGIWREEGAQQTLRDILQTVARVLDVDVSDADRDTLPESIQQILTRQRTLLILDNLETVEDLDAVRSFLCKIPENVKVAIASRHSIPFSDCSIRLERLPQAEATRLVEKRAEANGIKLSSEDAEKLAKKMAGIPLAIVYSVGQLAYYPLKYILERSLPPDGDLARYCLEISVNILKKEEQSYTLFLALAIFRQSASTEAVSAVAAVTGDTAIAEGFARLNQLCLVERYETGRYEMHSIAREYARSQLQALPNFESEARDRWIDWYRQFAGEHGGKDWREWQYFSEIEEEWENLIEATKWSINRQRYDHVLDFWRCIKSYSYARDRNRDLRTFWNLPLEWTKWLLETAEDKEDWSAAAEIKLDLGRNLSLRRDSKDLDIAASFLAGALKRHDNYKDTGFQYDVRISIAILRIKQQKFTLAERSLQEASKLLNEAPKMFDLENERIRVLYYKGQIYYRSEEYDDAKKQFQEMLTSAKSLRWERAEALAQESLAHIAIEQGRLEEAQSLLTKSRRAAEKRQDKCRMAYCDRGLARIEVKNGKFPEASQLFKQAEEAFRSLGMIPEAEETAKEIEQLPQ